MSPPGRNRPPCDNFTRGYPDRPPSRRVARVLCDRDGFLLTRVRVRSGARCPSWAAVVPAFSWSTKASSFELGFHLQPTSWPGNCAINDLDVSTR